MEKPRGLRAGPRLLGCLLAACVASVPACRTPGPAPAPITPEAYRRALGAVGIHVSRAKGKIDYLPAPATGSWTGMGRGAALGFEYTGGAFWSAHSPSKGSTSDKSGAGALVYAGLLALNTAGAVVGGVYGGIAGLVGSPKKEPVAAAKASLEKALAENDPVERLKAELTRLSAERPGDGFRVAGPADPAVDTLVEVEVLHAGLSGKAGLDPDLRVLVTLDVKAKPRRSPMPGALSFVGYESRGKPRKFQAWAADDASAFRAELGKAYPELADSVLKAVLPGLPSGP
ncbi:MAG: hypothetical protein HY927_05540 [Elusimicrobia bacterium]|nr:hypothetical protein [Elusimicrobiota bacterium]